MKNVIYILSVLLIVLTFSACEKEEGTGGLASIVGQVQAIEKVSVTETQTYYLPEVRVYIHYGLDSNAPDDDVRTGFDGSFAFKDLRKGDYRIVVYSDCAPFETDCYSGVKEIIKEVKIDTKDEFVDLGDIQVEVW